MISGLVVAGTNSGVGKTSFTLGLMRALTRRGQRVQPFKVGPDYLDPQWHQVASGQTSYNLDAWMTSPSYVRKLFTEKSADTIAIVEGVMGLFDGASLTTLTGSTAEIATLVNLPILLISSAQGTSRSFAAGVKGFQEFEAQADVAHVVANHCGSDRHAMMLNESLVAAGLNSLAGHLLRDSLPQLPSRHLGLSTPNELSDADAICNQLADKVEQGCDLDRLLEFNQPTQPIDSIHGKGGLPTLPFATAGGRLAIALDEAFFFYYPDNLELFQKLGTEIVTFSPLHDESLPEGTTALYLGGGYPERFAAQLSQNRSMKRSIEQFIEGDHPIYAECGGMMYLSDCLIDQNDQAWPMVGGIPITTRMLPRRKRLGYTQCETLLPTILGPAGTKLRGHEFHYSEVVSPALPDGWQHPYQVTNAKGDASRHAGYAKENILASYVHQHFGSLQ